MDSAFLLRGAIIGISIAAPVGPIGVLCIRRSLNQGFRTGFYTGLGAATADAIYGAVSAFGLTAISSLLLRFQIWLTIGGGFFLCYLGTRALLEKSSAKATPLKTGNRTGAYVSTLFLTLTNPSTILSFVAIFAGAGLNGAATAADAVAMVVGVFIGSASWWLFLSVSVALLGNRFNPRMSRATDILAGTIMLAFGVYLLSGGFGSLTPMTASARS